MVRKPKRPCHVISCNNLTDSKYCDKHQDKHIEEKQARNKYYNKYKRDKKTTAFYNSIPWDRLRQQAKIRDKYLCVQCKKQKKIVMADAVDHIIPIKVDWSKRLKLSNLQSLCNSCHKRKTLEDMKKYKDMT